VPDVQSSISENVPTHGTAAIRKHVQKNCPSRKRQARAFNFLMKSTDISGLPLPQDSVTDNTAANQTGDDDCYGSAFSCKSVEKRIK
jgi:hypothetical protein